jgi:hypothetical protein
VKLNQDIGLLGLVRRVDFVEGVPLSSGMTAAMFHIMGTE